MGSNALADRYDAVPYPSVPFARTHPYRLAAIARLHGVDAPDPTTARVLELGCAGGGNLIPMAVEAPDGQFVGIDVSPGQVERAREEGAALGLDNVRFEVADLSDFSEEQPFDYIIGHGIYSWVSSDVRAALWALVARGLSDNGVLYLSYNTMPGWHTRGALREMMKYHTGRIEDPKLQVQQARALLHFLTAHLPAEGDAWGQWLSRARRHIDESDDSFLFHDLLEPDNHAFSIEQMAASGREHGLGYLGEADASHWTDRIVNPDVVAALEPWTGDRVRLLHAIDLIRDRTFRSSLFTKAEVADQPDLDRLDGLFVAPCIEPSERDYTDDLRAAVDHVHAARPADVAVSEVPVTRPRLLGLCADRALELVIRPRTLPTALPERPEVWLLARRQLASGMKVLSNRRHETVEADRLDRELLPLVDGRRTAAELTEELVGAARDGRFRVQAKGQDISEAQVRKAIGGAVANRLQRYLERALLA